MPCNLLIFSMFCVIIKANIQELSSTSNISSTTVSPAKTSETAFAFETIPEEPITSLRCGQVVTCPPKGFLVYKPFKTLQKGERCTWILSIPNANKYWLKLVYTGLQGSTRAINASQQEAGLLVTSLKNGGAELVSHNLNSPGVDLTIHGATVIVTLWTVETYSALRTIGQTGFILQYSSSGKMASADVSEYYIQVPEPIEIFHPHHPRNLSLAKETYENSIILLVPRNNLISGNIAGSSVSMKFYYTKISSIHDELCDDEQILVYTFARPSASELPDYIHTKVICDDESTAIVKYNDVVLLVVRNYKRNPELLWSFKFLWLD